MWQFKVLPESETEQIIQTFTINHFTIWFLFCTRITWNLFHSWYHPELIHTLKNVLRLRRSLKPWLCWLDKVLMKRVVDNRILSSCSCFLSSRKSAMLSANTKTHGCYIVQISDRIYPLSMMGLLKIYLRYTDWDEYQRGTIYRLPSPCINWKQACKGKWISPIMIIDNLGGHTGLFCCC